MIDPQLVAHLQTQIASLGRKLEGVALGVTQTKQRSEMLSRMLSMHHFAILAIVDETSPESELREKIKQIAKRFKVKLSPTDPEYTDEGNPSPV